MGATSLPLTLTAAGLLYAIPSLPLFVVLPTILGIGVRDAANVIIALTLYGLALMVRAAADALSSVGAPVRLSSTALGYSPASRFWQVELPLAGPVLLAGIRVVSVSTIALVSVGVIIGSQNLGVLFREGKQRGILEEVVVGIGMSLLIALVFDLIIVLLGRLAMPWSREQAVAKPGVTAVAGLGGRATT